MVHMCAVAGCKSKSSKPTDNISFHEFPKNELRKIEWANVAQIDIARIKKGTVICSLHFKEEQYKERKGKKRYLKSDALPSEFPWSQDPQYVFAVPILNANEESDAAIEPKSLISLVTEGLTIEELSARSNSEAGNHTLAEKMSDQEAILQTLHYLKEYHSYHTNETIQQPETDDQDQTAVKTILKQRQTTQALDSPGSSLPSQSQNSENFATASESAGTSITPLSLSSVCSPSKEELKVKNLDLLKQLGQEKFSILRFLSAADIKYYTGFPSYTHLWSFYQFLLPEANGLKYVGKHPNNPEIGDDDVNLYESALRKPGRPRKLSPLEEFFIVLVRLRKNLPEKVLGDLYNVSQGYISKILNTWILFLPKKLQCLPIWPTAKEVNLRTPDVIKRHFPNLRVILDCSEFYINMPSATNAQRETFSSYKHSNTAKGLFAISPGPNGHITYFSNIYAGRTSDKKLVNHCHLIDQLEEGDLVMADRGFDIRKELEARKINLSIPDYLGHRDQFTEKEVNKSRDIAKNRIHIERAIRKVKEFQILQGVIPITLSPVLDKIYMICCHLSNFCGPLIRE